MDPNLRIKLSQLHPVFRLNQIQFIWCNEVQKVNRKTQTENIIFLIKETSVFSAVALADLMYVAKDLIALYYKTDEALFMLVIAYLIILLPISLICSLVERRVRYAEYGD